MKTYGHCQLPHRAFSITMFLAALASTHK